MDNNERERAIRSAPRCLDPSDRGSREETITRSTLSRLGEIKRPGSGREGSDPRRRLAGDKIGGEGCWIDYYGRRLTEKYRECRHKKSTRRLQADEISFYKVIGAEGKICWRGSKIP